MIQELGHGRKKGAAYPGALLKTGQTTQYNSELDDGYYEKGLAKSYTVNTSGAQSGTSNVDLAHYAGAAGAIAFNNSTKKITDSGNGLALFKTGDVILTDSPNNPGPFTITTGNVAGEITCTGATFVDETPAGVVTIKKRESISNNTVLDNNTGLTWLKNWSTKMGATSIGAMPWTGVLYDLFAWCAACNAANVGGYNDWRLPNIFELLSIYDYEAPNAYPDGTAFSVLGSYDAVSCTVNPSDTTRYLGMLRTSGIISSQVSSTAVRALLVRGG